MKRRLRLPFLLVCLFFYLGVSAQDTLCYYQLILEDAGADGWNGASLTVTVGDTERAFSLTEGTSNTVYLGLMDGDDLGIAYLSGMADEDVRFTLLNPAGDTLFAETGIMPFGGASYSEVITCAACVEVPSTSVTLPDIRAFRADVTWRSPVPDGGEFLLRLGNSGFSPEAPGLQVQDITVNDNRTRLTGLTEKTNYDLYIAQLCASGDTSAFVGPYSFTTLWAFDVGVSDIVGPVSSCDLDIDSVKLRLQNYGGQPLSLIPFAFSVNGNVQPIDMPRDGVYTGVLGKDSTDIVAFDRTFNFRQPGEYFIEAWTELEIDSFLHNDTVSTLIISVPTITSLPYDESFESWGGGWTVESEGDTTTWEHGYPGTDILDGPYDGTGAWATSLQGTYGNNELTYLVSPCFDFSNVAEDPLFSAQLNLDLESCCDGLWLEVTTDGGITWERVGRAGESVNWYNNDRSYWSGTTGWFQVSRQLPGVAGASDVRLRFVLRTDFANVREGAVIDAISIREQPTIDLAATSLTTPEENPCGLTDQELVLNIANLGLTPLTAFDVSYQVNGGEVITENVGPLALVANTQADYTFTMPFNSAEPGTYAIKAWINFDDDEPANDTAYLEIQSAYSLPFAEDFEKGITPVNWTIDEDAIVTDDHNNPSLSLSDNLFVEDSSFNAATPLLGPVRVHDSLFFDYRFVEFEGNGTTGTILGTDDRLEVYVSSDCGLTRDLLLTIDQSNHTPTAAYTQASINLTGYSGEFVRVYFEVTYGGGDYWFDLDNITVPNCSEDLAVAFQQAPYINGGSRVTALVDGGKSPYQYLWSTGATSANIVPPGDGGYSVTVTDALGCQGIAETTVTKVTDIRELTSFMIAPNPTDGQAWFTAEFREPVDGAYRVLNAQGQVLFQRALDNARTLREVIDLSTRPAGLYILQLTVEDQWLSRKILRSNH